MSQSVVFQVYSETGVFGVDMAIVAASVVQVLRLQGLEAYVKNEGTEGATWAAAHGIPEADDAMLESCEVLLRAWPADAWPVRPTGPRTMVDFVRYPADRSYSADYVVAFEADGSDFPGLIVWDALYPLPLEINEVAKDILESTILIHLGQDPGARLAGIRTAIHGFAGMSAIGFRYPDAASAPGILAVHDPWNYMASGDVMIVSPEFPFHLAAALRIPAILVANISGEVSRVNELAARGHSSFLPLGLISGLTNNQIRDAARDFRNDDGAKRIARLGGSEQLANQGVMRVASWVSRELIGKSVIVDDPYNVQGFNTVLDPHETVPVNAEDMAAGEEGEIPGALEVEVDVQVFTEDGVWTKPDGAKFVVVRMVGGGGGGGSGCRRAAATDRGGGGGGAGGAASEGFFDAGSLGDTEDILVGVGGLGGVHVGTDDTNGVIGDTGTESSFGGLIRANGGPAGGGGQLNNPGAGGVAPQFINAIVPATGTRSISQTGGDGGLSFDGNSGTFNFSEVVSGGGGGGGGAVDPADVSFPGGTGSCSGRHVAQLLGGAAGGGTGGPGPSVTFGEPFGGHGGGGGGGNEVGAAGEGGPGGLYGAGGGGGGSCVNGFEAGAGGQGANGIVVVVSYF